MTVVSSREFLTNQKRYFDMAVNENIFIKRGKNRFRLAYSNNEVQEDKIIHEPDEDFHRSITMDEFIEKSMVRLEKIDKMYAKK